MTPEWMEQAKCRGQADLMYPFDGSRKGREEQAAALALCRACPVINECRAYALENYEMHGIWGGLTPTERQRLAPYMQTCRECGRRFDREARPRQFYCSDLCLAESRRRQRREYEAQKRAEGVA